MLEPRREASAYAQTSLAISNLRGVLIVILVSFHSTLAYMGSTPAPAANFDQPPYLWLAFPIIDDNRFFGFDLYGAWVDVNLMALMFFLSGLFVAPSLRRKGAIRFASERLVRLGLPFLFSIFFLIPISLYAAFLRYSPDAGIADYLRAYRALPFFANGPAWFLWQLLVWSCLVAAIYAVWPATLDWLSAAVSGARRRPLKFVAGLFAVSALGYLPLTLVYGPFDWIERGPFSLQISRPPIYGAFFFAGVAVGAHGLANGVLAPDGALARQWRRFAVASPLLLFTWMGVTGVSLTWPDFAPWAVKVISALSYVGASVAGVMSLMAIAVRFCGKAIAWQETLSRNTLGIYIVHYVPLVWMQYLMLDEPLPALLKAAIVFAVTLPASLGLSALMRRQTLLARLIGEAPKASLAMPPPTPSRA